jgi:hypothetical protein
LFCSAGKSEQALHFKKVFGASAQAEAVAGPKQKRLPGILLSLTTRKTVLAWMFAFYKQWEGRTLHGVLRLMAKFGRLLPVVGDKLCLFSGSVGTLYCVIEEVLVLKSARMVVNKHNWKLFVPWVNTLDQALSVYEKLNDNSGFIFMRIAYPYNWKNIGNGAGAGGKAAKSSRPAAPADPADTND